MADLDVTIPDADVDNWGGRPTPAEAAALLRRYADKINLPPNDNNFADAAAVIDRLLVMVRAQNKYIAFLVPDKDRIAASSEREDAVLVAPFAKVLIHGEGADEEYQLVPTAQIETLEQTIRLLKVNP